MFLFLVFYGMKLGRCRGCKGARTGKNLDEEDDWQSHGRLCARDASDSIRPHNPARISESWVAGPQCV